MGHRDSFFAAKNPLVSALAAFVGLSIIAGFAVTLGVLPAVAAVSAAAGRGLTMFDSLPAYLKVPELEQASTIYAQQDGEPVPIATFFAQNRVIATWDEVSPKVKDAAIAAEDPHFYSEGGVSLRGTLRGAVKTLFGQDTQGGSTITQQYVKNVRTQLCNEEHVVQPDAPKAVRERVRAAWQECNRDASGVTISRKLQEIRYASELDRRYTKRQVLLGYLNIAFFGGNVYGVQAAARYYFGVDADRVTLPQAATLAAIVNEPNTLRIDQSAKTNKESNPGNGFAATKARRNYVLQRMLDFGLITAKQHARAAAAPVTPHITPARSGCITAEKFHAGFFCNYVQHEMLRDPAFGATAQERMRAFQRGGFDVYTTLDLDIQKVAHDSLTAYVPPTRAGMDLGGTQVALRVGTGQIISMVGNRAYDDSADPPAGSTAVNYATDAASGGSAGFQTGSTFKPFVLGAWLESGRPLYQSVNADTHFFAPAAFHSTCPDRWGPWHVDNAESWEGGTMSVLNATVNSVNTAYARMETQLDLCDVSAFAKSLLVHSADPASNPWHVVPPMVLGTNYVSPLTMATAYAAFADKGRVCTPVAIERIVGPRGQDVPAPQSTCTQAIPEKIANTIAYALQRVIQYGTAATANPQDGVPVLAKTGTSTNAYDNWLVASSTKVASALWIGNIQGVGPKGAKANMIHQFFRAHGTGPLIQGNNVKFPVDKPILAAINAKYGGDAFAAPERTLLYGSHYEYNPARPVPSAPAAPPQGTPPSGGSTTPPSTTPPAAPPTATPHAETPSPPARGATPGRGTAPQTGATPGGGPASPPGTTHAPERDATPPVRTPEPGQTSGAGPAPEE